MTLRILVAHNAYQWRGGEDTVVEAEIDLLRQHGHEVVALARHNDEIAAMSRPQLATQTLWSRRTGRDFHRLFQQFRPDVVHVHNTFPLISPSLYWAADAARVPVVQTLHNFRLLCPQAMLLRQSKVCEDCVGHLPWRAVTRRCYRDSAAQSAVLAGMLTLHRALGTYDRKVTRYIALNGFCRDKFIQGGLPADRIVIKPNFVDWPAPPAGDRIAPPEGIAPFLFVGRLSTEKGIAVLIEALRLAPELRVDVAGDGPLQDLARTSPGVRLLGPLTGEQVRTRMAAAQALVLPSIWYENLPRTLVEAYACGLPVIASRLGALAELVQHGHTGLLFEPGDATDLARQLRWAAAQPAAMRGMGQQARQTYLARYTPQANHTQLQAIYTEASDALRSEAAQDRDGVAAVADSRP